MVIGGPVVLAQEVLRWGDTNAQITTAEFLEFYFMVALGHHETKEALNSFNVINFYPSRSPPEGILVVTQTYNVASRSTAEPSLRREIRKVADSLVENFTSRFGLAVIKKRWPVSNPKSALVVKHVRTNVIRALAVTLNGLTSFGADDFKRAEALVKARGGVWAW